MLFSEDFTNQWKSLRDYIASTMIKDTINGKPVNYTSLCSVYKNETLRWSMDGQYNAMWLDNLRKADPAVADSFLAELNGFTFQQAAKAPSNNALAIVLPVAGIAAGLAIGLPLHWAALPLAGTCIGLGAVGGVAGSKLSNSKQAGVAKAETDVYTQQLDDLGDRLKVIVKKADGKEPSDM